METESSQAESSQAELEDGEIEDDGQFLQEVEENIRKKTTKMSKKLAASKKQTENATTTAKTNSDFEMDDYELLLARHQLIQQQLQKVKEKELSPKLMNEPSKESSTPLSEEQKNNNENKKAPKRQNSKESKESQTSATSDTMDNEELELLQMRKALLEQTASKKNLISPIKSTENQTSVEKEPDLKTPKEVKTKSAIKKKIQNPPIIDLTVINDENEQKMKQKVIPVLNISKTPDITVPGETMPNTKRRKLSTGSNKVAKKQPIQTIGPLQQLQPSLTTPKSTKKKRRRGGKRAKYLAYRAQQKEQQQKELAILQQQQAIAFDNYNTVPMDIDNDDDLITAPLPLIDTPITQPPPPPPLPLPNTGLFLDTFQPVEDRMGLSMTTTNVAWMPGYVEQLEPDNSYVQKPNFDPKPTNTEPVTNEPVIAKGKVKVEEKEKAKDIDEKEVWALRAQALKSLACKRASKVKMAKKEKKAPLVSKTETISKDILNLSPLPSPKPSTHTVSTVPSNQITSIPIKVNALIAKFKPPVHPQVIIQLGKDDFESDEEEDKVIVVRPTVAARAKVQQRRASATDEELLTELRLYTDRAQSKVKTHSILIQKDQVEYKKLNNELAEKKILFKKQSDEIKTLQAKLQAALREKTNTKKAHTKMHSMLLDVKQSLKEKITLRKKVEDDVIKAKAVVNVQKISENAQLNMKVRDQIIDFSETFRHSFQRMTQMEKEAQQHLSETSQDEDNVTTTTSSASENDNKKPTNKNELQRTAASVKSMSKEDLSRLELQLREKLISFKKKKDDKIKQRELDEEEKNTKVEITHLPSVANKRDLNKLKETILKCDPSSIQNGSHLNLLEELQNVQTATDIKFTKEFMENSTVRSHKFVDTEETSNDSDEVTLKYNSPLLRFKSYRLNPYFRTQAKNNINSPTFANTINARKTMCKYDLLGSCNDEKCRYWHFNDSCELNVEELIESLVTYDSSFFDATDQMSMDIKLKLLHSFTQQFINQYSSNSKISTDEHLLILWNKMKERRKASKLPVYECVSFEKRDLPLNTNNNAQAKDGIADGENSESIGFKSKQFNETFYRVKNKATKRVDKVSQLSESQEIRYFSNVYQTVEIMEKSLESNPTDIKLWLSLARFHMKEHKEIANAGESDNNNKTALEKALNVLSRSLEANRDSEDLWIEYLKLFAKNSTADELRELSYQAVMYAATYNVWWTCLELEKMVLGKQEICTEMIKFITDYEEDYEVKSHALIETLLYLCRLLESREHHKLIYHCLLAALGNGMIEDEAQKICIDNMKSHLTKYDLSLLWICFLSMKCFNCLPTNMFAPDQFGPSRLVNKEKFVLDWSSKKMLITVDEARSSFHEAFKCFPNLTLDDIKSIMILYENLAAFELANGNIHVAGEIFRSLVTVESSFVEGWVLFLSLFFKHSSMDTVVKISEDAMHKCDNDVVIVYIYSEWLHRKGMPNLALDKLAKCIQTYFQLEPDDPENTTDVLYLYKAVLGLDLPYDVTLPVYLPKPSEHLKLFYWQCYCLLLKIRQIPPTITLYSSAIDEALESAVHQYTNRENTKKIWASYIEHKLASYDGIEISTKMCNQLIDLLLRCIMAIPSGVNVKENKLVSWKDYAFQNKMVDKCIRCVPENRRSVVYHKLIDIMPDNVELAHRICVHEFSLGNYQQVRSICGGVLHQNPHYIPLWLMAIKVECKSNSIREARWLYEETIKYNPYSAVLWREYSCFEIAYTNDLTKLEESLKNITERALKYEIKIADYLRTLSPGG
ncbi:zinc finger C3H1 domain-containing protein-like [Clytia hemisphaerica]|uniref:Putative zinc-finger domain-containing protein n=1 Tax=Clytia hemisphaerica TaxID=252671 RepID=A0A7M5UZT4_9CNID